METALEFGKPFDPSLGGALEVLEISKKAPTVKIAFPNRSHDLKVKWFYNGSRDYWLRARGKHQRMTLIHAFSRGSEFRRRSDGCVLSSVCRRTAWR
jgi:hypothetical protein